MEPYIRELEKSSLKAWPALEELIYDGWVLRFSRGYTKRANSVNVLDESTIDLPEKVAQCERIYHQRDLPPIFRITPLSPPDLDGVLKDRDYQILDPTLVMTRDIRNLSLPLAVKPSMAIHDLDPWLALFEGLRGRSYKSDSVHGQIINAIKDPCVFASTPNREASRTCGLGVLNDKYFGIFDIITHPSYRRQGFATALVSQMLVWAKDHGGSMAYLQVMESNSPGMKLYRELGLRLLINTGTVFQQKNRPISSSFPV